MATLTQISALIAERKQLNNLLSQSDRSIILSDRIIISSECYLRFHDLNAPTRKKLWLGWRKLLIQAILSNTKELNKLGIDTTEL